MDFDFCRFALQFLQNGWDRFAANATALSALATFAAVVVAMVANHRATQQLRSALVIHEQQKNVDLLEKRLELARKVADPTLDLDFELQILFFDDDTIIDHYRNLKLSHAHLQSLEDEIRHFLSKAKIPDSEGGCISCDASNVYALMERNGPDTGLEEKFRIACTTCNRARGNCEENKNAYESYKSLKRAKEDISSRKDKLNNAMLNYIKKGIRPM